MADEVKQEKSAGFDLSVFFKIALGMVFLVFGGVFLYKGWHDLFAVVKGLIGPFLILAGIITLIMAKE